MKKSTQLLYGAAYYHEYQPYERLKEDVELMREAGVTYVRIGESTWSSWEPADGVFETEYMDRVLDAMHDAGIAVIVGTPTYAVPPWMIKAFPDIMVETLQRRVGYGGRQNMDIVHPEYRWRAERIIRRIVEHVRDHPAVIGFQIDNETKSYHTAGKYAQALFLEHLKTKFGTPEALSKAWNLTYWSQRITEWDEFHFSGDWTNPSLLLEWRRFQQKLTTDFLLFQSQIVKELRRPDQFITQNFDFVFKQDENGGPQPEVDHFLAVEAVDVAGVDIYHSFQDRFDGVLIGFGGDWTRSLLRGENYLVLETNAQSTGIALGQSPPYDGQLRQAALAHIAHGARLVGYWPWSSIHAGNEIFWRGILGHDLEPNRLFAEMQRTAQDFARLKSLANQRITNEVAIVHSQDSHGALLDRPFSPTTTYADWMLAIYRSLFRRSIGVDFVPAESGRLDQYKLVIVPALYATSDAALEELVRYVKSGGHLVLTFKTGFVDENHRVRPVRMPAILREIAGISYQEFSNIGQLPVVHEFPDVPPGASYAGEFLEYLVLEGAESLAAYDHPFFGKFPAITRHNLPGAGSTTYMGSCLGPELLEAALMDCVRSAELIEPTWKAPLLWRSGLDSDGRKVYFGFNFSETSQSATWPLSSSSHSLLDHRLFQPGEVIQIEPWGVVVAMEGLTLLDDRCKTCSSD